MNHEMDVLSGIIERHSQTGSNWTPFSVTIVAIEYAEFINGSNKNEGEIVVDDPKHKWIFRNDEPAHEAEAHAYEHDISLSVCGNYNRANFDWTEMDGERCIECQRIIKEHL